MILSIVLPVILAYFTWKLLKFLELRRLSNSLNKNLNIDSFFTPGFLIPVALQLPEFRPFNVQLTELFHSHFEWFREKSSTCISFTSFFPIKRHHFIASPEACALLSSPAHENVTIAPSLEFNSLIDVWGRNSTVLSTTGIDWVRHRRIASASFSKRNIKLVWNEVHDVLAKGWFVQLDRESNESGTTYVEDIGQLALKAISAAAFGQRVDWDSDLIIPRGHKMAFPSALAGALKGLIPKAILPLFILKLISNSQTCFDELELYLKEMIEERRAESNDVERHDLFSRLLYASDSEIDPRKKLSTAELMGNVFLFIVAGHETSARNMGFNLIMQALWPDVQEKIFEEVSVVLPNSTNESTEYKDVMVQLPYTRAAVNEALRIWPSVVLIRREIIADVQVTSHRLPTSSSLHKQPILQPYLMKKGDRCDLSIFALHMNPFVWGDDVEDYKPERFLDDSNIEKGSFMPFGGSSRICIGKEFAMTEMICFLAYTIKNYKITLPEYLQADSILREGESQMQRMERVLKTSIPTTLIHQKIGLEFTRRIME